MPKYICYHTLPPGQRFSKEQLSKFSESAQHDPKVRGYRSFSNLTEGKLVCIMEAPDRETLAAWFEGRGLPVDDITQLEMEGEAGYVKAA